MRLAIKQFKTIRITDSQGEVREVEPYAVFKDGELLHCYQTSGREGWRNLKIDNIRSIEYIGRFFPRPEFNPDKLKGLQIKIPELNLRRVLL